MCRLGHVYFKNSGSQPFFSPGRTMVQVQVSRAARIFHISFYPLTNLSILMLNSTELMAADDYLNLILPDWVLVSVG